MHTGAIGSGGEMLGIVKFAGTRRDSFHFVSKSKRVLGTAGPSGNVKFIRLEGSGSRVLCSQGAVVSRREGSWIFFIVCFEHG